MVPAAASGQKASFSNFGGRHVVRPLEPAGGGIEGRGRGDGDCGGGLTPVGRRTVRATVSRNCSLVSLSVSSPPAPGPPTGREPKRGGETCRSPSPPTLRTRAMPPWGDVVSPFMACFMDCHQGLGLLLSTKSRAARRKVSAPRGEIKVEDDLPHTVLPMPRDRGTALGGRPRHRRGSPLNCSKKGLPCLTAFLTPSPFHFDARSVSSPSWLVALSFARRRKGPRSPTR